VTSIRKKVHKKGTKEDSGSYKGINVNSTFVNRPFAKIIYNKLQGSSKHIISKNQNGFSPDRGYTDNLFIVQQITKKRIVRRENMVFIDLEKAYGR